MPVKYEVFLQQAALQTQSALFLLNSRLQTLPTFSKFLSPVQIASSPSIQPASSWLVDAHSCDRKAFRLSLCFDILYLSSAIRLVSSLFFVSFVFFFFLILFFFIILVDSSSPSAAASSSSSSSSSSSFSLCCCLSPTPVK